MIANRAPAPCLRIDPAAQGLSEPPRAFFRRDTTTVARDLIGAWIARRWRGRWYGARIVETEAYVGPTDAAAHSWKGRRTARVEPMHPDRGPRFGVLLTRRRGCANVAPR